MDGVLGSTVNRFPVMALCPEIELDRDRYHPGSALDPDAVGRHGPVEIRLKRSFEAIGPRHRDLHAIHVSTTRKCRRLPGEYRGAQSGRGVRCTNGAMSLGLVMSAATTNDSLGGSLASVSSLSADQSGDDLFDALACESESGGAADAGACAGDDAATFPFRSMWEEIAVRFSALRVERCARGSLPGFSESIVTRSSIAADQPTCRTVARPAWLC